MASKVMRLTDVPVEALRRILKFCDIEDLSRLLMCCHYLHGEVVAAPHWARGVAQLESANTLNVFDSMQGHCFRGKTIERDVRESLYNPLNEMYMQGARFWKWLSENDPRVRLGHEAYSSLAPYKRFCLLFPFAKLTADNINLSFSLDEDEWHIHDNELSLTFGPNRRKATHDSSRFGWTLKGSYEERHAWVFGEKDPELFEQDQAKVDHFRKWADLEKSNLMRFQLVMNLAAMQLIRMDMSNPDYGPEQGPEGFLHMYNRESFGDSDPCLIDALNDFVKGEGGEMGQLLWDEILYGPFEAGQYLHGVSPGSDEHLDRLADDCPVDVKLFGFRLACDVNPLGFLAWNLEYLKEKFPEERSDVDSEANSEGSLPDDLDDFDFMAPDFMAAALFGCLILNGLETEFAGSSGSLFMPRLPPR